MLRSIYYPPRYYILHTTLIMYPRFKAYLSTPEANVSKEQLPALLGLCSAFEAKENKDMAHKIKLPFGKYKAETLDDVHAQYKGRTYLTWMTKQDWFKEGDWDELKSGLRGLGYAVV